MAGFPSGAQITAGSSMDLGRAARSSRTRRFYLSAGNASSRMVFCRSIVFGFPAVNGISLQSAYFRENMLTARLDYNLSDNMKWFARLSYDNANQIGPSDSQSNFRNQLNVPAAVFGLDWNRGRFVHSARFGYQKMVNAINPALGDSMILAGAPLLHVQIGSYRGGAKRGRSAANDTARPLRALRRQHGLQVESHHSLRRSDSSHCARGFFAPGNYAVGDQFERTGCDR